ncbi:MAG: translation initiation factor IF-2, partial [Clostridia bacterium]|nr:translation initiation factor IF-2 [Clostridia bacterium]
MAKTRVYELAKELKIANKELMGIMNKLGIYTRSHMSVLENGEVIKIRNHYRRQRRAKAALRKKQQAEAELQATKNVEQQLQTVADETAAVPATEVAQPKPAEKQLGVEQQQNQTAAEEKEKTVAHGSEQRKRKTHEQSQPATTGERSRKQTARPQQQQASEADQKQQRSGQQTRTVGSQAIEPQERQPTRDAQEPVDGATRTGQRGTRRAVAKQLKIPKPPEAVTRDLPEKRRERSAGKPDRQAQEIHSRKREAERQRQERKLRRERSKSKTTAPKQEPPKVVRKITLTGDISVQELAKKLGKTAAQVIKFLMEQGIMATINQELDVETAAIVAQDMGAIVDIKVEKPLTELEDIVDSPESLQERPPVVAVMGHVDHGKTSLLDAIRRTAVTASEAGGITQHIGAYQVKVNYRKITFLDTPGHAAFTAMRARGAQATDIAVLVVAADDGVMPQTVEAINHAKAAEVTIIVAINKIDRPEANPERVKQQLTEYGLVAEEWGGNTVMVPISALKKQGINELLEMILLIADLKELKANPNRPARGIIIEAQLDKGRGPVATMLVQKGTLKIGDNVIAGSVYGRVRAMFNDRGERVNSAGPSTPVEVLGLSELPQAGDIFQVVEEEKFARQVSLLRQEERRQEELKAASKVSLDELFKQMEAGEVKELNLIVKADVQGSVEALHSALEELSTNEVKVNLLHGGVGAITESDVMLAAASKAIIIGF